MSDKWKAYDCLRDEGYTHLTVNHSLNFVDPDTGAHTQRIENTWWGIKRSMPRTGTSKDLFQSYLQEWLWRQHYGDDPFGNIMRHIADLLYFRTQRCVNYCSSIVPLYVTVRDLIATSWRIRNKIHSSQHSGTELEKGNREEKTPKDTMKVSNNFILLRLHLITVGK